MPHRTKAFTLIELLIVIAIIAILTVSFLPNALKAPARARDSGKIKMLQNIAAALDSYRETHGAYPATAAGCLSAGIAGQLGLELPSSDFTPCTYYYWANTAGNASFGPHTFYAIGFDPEVDANTNSPAYRLENNFFDIALFAGGSFSELNKIFFPQFHIGDNKSYVITGPK